MTEPSLAAELMTTAVCNTDHPADAASALLMAAGELLHRRLGDVGAVATLRAILDEVETKMIARLGRQPGEAVQ
jgi:hypothetical protein